MGNKAGGCGRPGDDPREGAINAPGAAAEEDASGREFKFEITSALMRRSFCKVGYMNLYAVMLVDGQEIFRTQPAKSMHKAPVWSATFNTRGYIPDNVVISVWDKNSLHKDVFCGDVTIPCSADMGRIEGMEFELHKRQKPTGMLKVTLEAEEGDHALRAPVMTSAGMELDLLLGYISDKQNAPAAGDADPTPKGESLVTGISMRQDSDATPAGQDDDGEDDADKAAPNVLHFPASDVGVEPAEPAKPAEPVEPAAPPAEPAAPLAEPAAPPAEPAAPPAEPEPEVEEPKGQTITDALSGNWTCVATQGLEEFLVATGVGMFQRKIANAARWPSWEFEVNQAEGKVKFQNHSAMGLLRTEIFLDKNYTTIDGKKNKLDCFATWTPNETGGVLKIWNSFAMGKYTEERIVNKDTLTFVLTNPEVGCSWGRTFERAR